MTYALSLCIILLALYMEETETVFAEESTKYVCTGDNIQLFRNVTIDTTDTVVSLYMLASNERTLAMWTAEKTTINFGYTRKVFLDKSGDIWIFKVSPSDEAQYILTSLKGPHSFRYNVTLSVQAAPTINCKPTIKRVGDILFASLNANECGKPMASVDWLYYPGSHNEGYELILPKTNRHGIYYACISGPAVKCARTSKLSDYCSTHYIDDTLDGHDISSERRISTYFVAIITSVAILLLLSSIGLCLILRRKCRHVTRSEIKKKRKCIEHQLYEALATHCIVVPPVPTNTELSDTKRGYEKNIRYYSNNIDITESGEENFDMTVKAWSDQKNLIEVLPRAEKTF